jgi:hypothetical protein
MDGVINDLLGKHDVLANFPTGKVILGDRNKMFVKRRIFPC